MSLPFRNVWCVFGSTIMSSGEISVSSLEDPVLISLIIGCKGVVQATIPALFKLVFNCQQCCVFIEGEEADLWNAGIEGLEGTDTDDVDETDEDEPSWFDEFFESFLHRS